MRTRTACASPRALPPSRCLINISAGWRWTPPRVDRPVCHVYVYVSLLPIPPFLCPFLSASPPGACPLLSRTNQTKPHFEAPVWRGPHFGPARVHAKVLRPGPKWGSCYTGARMSFLVWFVREGEGVAYSPVSCTTPDPPRATTPTAASAGMRSSTLRLWRVMRGPKRRSTTEAGRRGPSLEGRGRCGLSFKKTVSRTQPGSSHSAMQATPSASMPRL